MFPISVPVFLYTACHMGKTEVGPVEGGRPPGASRAGGERGGFPKMVSLRNNQNEQRNEKSEEKTQTKIRLVICHDSALFYQKVKVYGRYAHYGLRGCQK